MVEGLGELLLELAAGAVEGALEWLTGGDDEEEREPEGRYVDHLYEERPPPPRDLNP